MKRVLCLPLLILLAPLLAAAEGEDRLPRFGLGWHYETNAFEAAFTHRNLQDADAGAHELGGDSASPKGAVLAWGPGAGFLSFGADLSYSYHIDYDGCSKRIYVDGSFVGFHDLTVDHLAFKPKLYFSPGRLFGSGKDAFRPYVGAAFNYYLLELMFDAENFAPSLPKEETFVEESLTGISPLVGAEFRLGRRFSAYAEVAFDPELKPSSPRRETVSSVEFQSLPRASGGPHWSFGFKWFLF
jgi:hypothetical protein